jgi:vacuolar-type H+-ATPase subunit C/Vma6
VNFIIDKHFATVLRCKSLDNSILVFINTVYKTTCYTCIESSITLVRHNIDRRLFHENV